MEKLLYAALGGAAVWWYLKSSCGCSDHAATSTSPLATNGNTGIVPPNIEPPRAVTVPETSGYDLGGIRETTVGIKELDQASCTGCGASSASPATMALRPLQDRLVVRSSMLAVRA